MANAIEVKKTNVVDIVAEKVRNFQTKGELDLPARYSPSNALKSAWLELQEVKDRNSKPALEVCTTRSVANALLDMVVQGLNPAKNQCYFIVYGNRLVMQRSYFGTMHVAKAVCPEIADIYADVVYADDNFEYEKSRGRTVITTHTQKLSNVSSDKLIAAYCTIVYKDGSENSTIMTLEECKQSWTKSKMGAITADGEISKKSTHGQFTSEMMIRTVTNRACKPIINSSDDGNLEIARLIEEESAAEAAEAEVQENANSVFIDIPDEPTVDAQTGEVISEPAADSAPDPGF